MGQRATGVIGGRRAAKQLVSGLERLLTKSMARASWTTYTRAIAALDGFLRQFYVAAQLPVAPITVVLFVSHKHNQKYAANTTEMYGSAISYIRKLHGLSDPNDNFLVRKAIMEAK